MEGGVSLDDIELVSGVDEVFELPQEMGVACVRSIKSLNFEAKIIIGGRRIDGTLEGQHRLIEQNGVGLFRGQLTEVQSIRGIARVHCDASFHRTGDRQSIPPRRRRFGSRRLRRMYRLGGVNEEDNGTE